jgi:aminopeptidase N
MVKDSLESSHPVSVEVNDPNEIFSIFDELTYIKVKLCDSIYQMLLFEMNI